MMMKNMTLRQLRVRVFSTKNRSGAFDRVGAPLADKLTDQDKEEIRKTVRYNPPLSVNLNRHTIIREDSIRENGRKHAGSLIRHPTFIISIEDTIIRESLQ